MASTWLVAVFLLMSAPTRAAEVHGLIGPDDRREACDPGVHPALRKAARSVAVLMSRHRLANGDTMPRHRRVLSVTYGDRYHLCPDERFAEQPAPGYCTGFLVASDLLVTAGHCVRSATDCANLVVVFDYAVQEGSLPQMVSESSVFFCRRIVAHTLDPLLGIDVSVLSLDRPTRRKPLALRREGEPDLESEIASIGHPSGLPTKVITGGQLLGREAGFYFTDLDSFAGSSGSPVIGLDSGLVEGMVVRGDSDFERTDHGCYRARHCPTVEECRPTEAVAASEILKLLP